MGKRTRSTTRSQSKRVIKNSFKHLSKLQDDQSYHLSEPSPKVKQKQEIFESSLDQQSSKIQQQLHPHLKMNQLRVKMEFQDQKINKTQRHNQMCHTREYVRIKPKQQKQNIILKAQEFKKIEQMNFRIFGEMLARTKSYALMLIDSQGSIIYSDKLGNQLFQGSLNNFETMRIQNLFLVNQKQVFQSALKSINVYDERTILKWLIYSKNTKRRYSRIPFAAQEADEITFFRFLKALCVRVRPVCLNFSNYRDIQGFWNSRLVNNSIDLECFLLEVRLSGSHPNLDVCSLRQDPVLKKFIDSNKAKAEKWAHKNAKPSPSRRSDTAKKVKKDGDISMEAENYDKNQKKQRQGLVLKHEYEWKLQMNDS